MSVLFYRRPDYVHKANGPINISDCARYVERAKNSERAIPDGLGFEDVMTNKALPPCSLNDFMDYLLYVEHNAENLQFYLWYKDYKRRFNALNENEKALSPKWVPEIADIPCLQKASEKEPKQKIEKETIAGILDSEYDLKNSALFKEDENPTSPKITSFLKDNGSTEALSISDSTTLGPTNAEVAAQAGLKWLPFTIQPMRDEINRVIRHYLAVSSPRELNLSHKDRDTCLHALQHTTHPSALFHAAKIAEATLRGQSHPNFIRWSICNGNKPRVFFVRTMGVSHITFGFMIAVFLTLSGASRWWRIFALPMWFVGCSTMVASYKGLCIILHHSHSRDLRPWEIDGDAELGEERRDSFVSTAQRDVRMASRTGSYNDLDKGDDMSFRPSSMQTFGGKNSFDDASWVERYQKEPLLQKVFEKSVWTQDETLRILQDRIVLGANLWGMIISVILTISFVALPKGNIY